jgi:hypothetical protein
MLLDTNVYVMFKYSMRVAKRISCYIWLLLVVDYF